LSNETDIPKTPNIDICIECKTKLNDNTPKPVSNCPLCGRPMCEHHLRAKLAQVPDFKSSGKKHSATMEILEKDYGSGDGHPCLPYTINFWQQYEKQFEYRIPKTITKIHGSSRGGLVPAVQLSNLLRPPFADNRKIKIIAEMFNDEIKPLVKEWKSLKNSIEHISSFSETLCLS
jgi:hypothetical protein